MSGVYGICRWCGERTDSHHEEVLRKARPWDWHRRKISHSNYGKKRQL